MKVEPLSIDIVGLVGACSYALDCIEAELVNVKNKHGKRVAYISVRMAEYWSIKSDALQDLAMCALLHDNALTQYISEERCFLYKIIPMFINRLFDQMFQTLYYIMSMWMEPVHFKRWRENK